MAATDPFAAGQLPSEFPEAQDLPSVRRLLAEQVDMQFADLRALMLLPRDDIAPNVGCNLTATAMICNQVSGFSIWFFHARYAQTLVREENGKRPLSRRRFLGFVRAYYPRATGEPRVETVAERLYETRNVLSHSLGLGDLRAAARRRQVALVKPDPPLAPDDVVDLELQRVFPLAGAPVRREGSHLMLFVPGLYWAAGQMLRAALVDQPGRCEQQATALLDALPVPVTGSSPTRSPPR